MRILFITSTRIGDAVLTTGLLSHLVEQYPKAAFTIACGPAAADLFRAVPRLEALLLLRKERYNGHWFKLWGACAKTRWDMIVDMRNSLVSRILRGKDKRYALAHGTGRHKVLDCAAVLNLSPPPAPRLWLDSRAEKAAKALIDARAPFLALGPCANWNAKQWPIDRFTALAVALTGSGGAMEGCPVVLAASSHEKEQLAPLYAALGPERCIDLVGQDLLTVGACLSRARLFIGNDSGLTHIAAAAGAPTLALFGPGNEAVYGPWGENTAVVRTKESAQELMGRLEACRDNAFVPCLMTGLDASTVREKAEKMLGNKAGKAGGAFLLS